MSPRRRSKCARFYRRQARQRKHAVDFLDEIRAALKTYRQFDPAFAEAMTRARLPGLIGWDIGRPGGDVSSVFWWERRNGRTTIARLLQGQSFEA